MEDKSITLTIATPTESQTVVCDAVTLSIPDSEAHPNTGGSVGIRRGHTDALIALADNAPIIARAAGAEVLRVVTAGGFAVVRKDGVTVVCDRLSRT